MRAHGAYPSIYRQPSQLGGLKKLLRKAAGPVLAAGAVVSGNPQLAIPALQAGNSLKKKKKVEAPVEPLPEPGFWDTLTTGDRNALLIGGTVVGTLLVSKLLIGGRRR